MVAPGSYPGKLRRNQRDPMKRSALCKKIAEVPRIGPITATAMVAAVGDAKQFRNG